MTTFTYTPLKTTYDISDKYIWRVYFQVAATVDSSSAEYYGSVNLDRPETLIPYENVSKENLVDWIKNKLGTSEVAAIEGTLDNSVRGLATSTTKAQGLPY
tara:strand:+ start:3106 stop:3408 length:303 start_codon:yes stop_codon:yes gene_type:complete